MGVPYRFSGLRPHKGSLPFPTYYCMVQIDADAAKKASEIKLEEKVEREFEKEGRELMASMQLEHDRAHFSFLKGMLPMYFSVPGNFPCCSSNSS